MVNLLELINKAESGDPEAQYQAAYHILNEIALEENDKEIIKRAVDYYRKAAMNGYSQGLAALELGDLYYRGRYVVQDYRQAVMWYRTSTRKLHPIGYYCLGRCFYSGNGVKQDYAKAFDSFLKGALTRYINNYIMLGDMFKKGLFVERDHKFAAKLYQHVLDSEKELYEKNRIFSDAYGQVCLRLGECFLHGN